MAGDLVLLPFAAEHKLWRGNAEFVPASSIVTRDTKEGVWSFSHGGGGTETRFVCGFIELAEMMFAPMFRSLPEMLVDRADDEAVGSGIANTIDDLLAKVDALTPGAEVILGRMMELLFVELLRRHAGRLPRGQQGPARRAQRSAGRPRAAAPAGRSRRGAGRPTSWRAKSAPRAPCWASASIPCWASRRSST